MKWGNNNKDDLKGVVTEQGREFWEIFKVLTLIALAGFSVMGVVYGFGMIFSTIGSVL